jgi:hypothetical protein
MKTGLLLTALAAVVAISASLWTPSRGCLGYWTGSLTYPEAHGTPPLGDGHGGDRRNGMCLPEERDRLTRGPIPRDSAGSLLGDMVVDLLPPLGFAPTVLRIDANDPAFPGRGNPHLLSI